MISQIIIADDLTGANDTAVHYAKNGFSTIVQVFHDVKENIPAINGYDVLALNTGTRSFNKNDAYMHVFKIAQKLESSYGSTFYKKIDSILRGNPSSELEAIMDAVNSSLALVAPSFPDNKRVVFKGILSSPNQKINAVQLFSQNMKKKVENVPLHLIRENPNKLADIIMEKQLNGSEVLIFDACTNDDLEIIAQAAKLMEQPKVLCGSAGLAIHLSQNNSHKPLNRYETPKNKDNKLILIAIGSYKKETAEQIQIVSNYYNIPIIKLETKLVLQGKQAKAIEKSFNAINAEIKKGNKIALFTVDTLFQDYVEKQESNQSPEVVDAIGKVARKIYDLHGIYTIVSAGGDTSLKISQNLNCQFIKLLDEISPGIPVGEMLGGDKKLPLLVTKSGGFGDGNALLNVIKYLELHGHDQILV